MGKKKKTKVKIKSSDLGGKVPEATPYIKSEAAKRALERLKGKKGTS